MLGFAGISSFAVSTAAWRTARQKKDFWVGKIIFLKLETSDCWDLLGFLLLRCLLLLGVKAPVQTVKETGCISLYCGVIVFFSLSFWGGGGTWWHGPSTC